MKMRKPTISAITGCVILPVPLLPLSVSQARVGGDVADNQGERKMNQHPYLGMWVTADGRIRQELLPNNRYDEARGTRKNAYQGRYEANGIGSISDRETRHSGARNMENTDSRRHPVR